MDGVGGSPLVRSRTGPPTHTHTCVLFFWKSAKRRPTVGLDKSWGRDEWEGFMGGRDPGVERWIREQGLMSGRD